MHDIERCTIGLLLFRPRDTTHAAVSLPLNCDTTNPHRLNVQTPNPPRTRRFA
jgi:hypothetical protein